MELSGVQALVALGVLIVGPGGAAAVAVKVSLNGARKEISKTAATVERVEATLNATSVTVARLDERSEDHERRIDRLEDAA